MKSLAKSIAVASLATVATAANAGLSTTIGMVSDYIYRGASLGDAGAYWSLDFEQDGFYAGAWAIDDGSAGNNGLEIDYYLGYAGETDGFSYGIGFTRYEYTYTSDYEQEINLSVGTAGFGLDIAIGTDNDEETGSEDEADYLVWVLSYANGPWGVALGSVDTDEGDNKLITESERKWFEVSYSQEIGTFDVTATIGQPFDQESTSGNVTTDITSAGTQYLVLDVSKGFDL